jgi:hypothetical protein
MYDVSIKVALETRIAYLQGVGVVLMESPSVSPDHLSLPPFCSVVFEQERPRSTFFRQKYRWQPAQLAYLGRKKCERQTAWPAPDLLLALASHLALFCSAPQLLSSKRLAI